MLLNDQETDMAQQSGEQISEVTGLLSEAGAGIAPEEDDYTPDINNDGSEENEDLENNDETTDDQEIDQEEGGDEDAGEGEGEGEGEDEDAGAEGGDEEQDVENINQLAEFLEVDEAQLYDIQIPLGDGLAPVSIGALKDGYMENERTRVQLTNDRAAFEQEVEQFKTQVQQQSEMPSMSDELIQAAVAMESIKNQYNSIDWDTFEEQDAAKALLHQNKLTNAFNQAQQNYDNLIKQQSEKAEAQMKNVKAQSRQKILEKIPEWNDPKVFQKEGDAIGNMLGKYGYTAKEISEVYDPRLSILLRDFMLLSAKAESANAEVKKLRLTSKKIKSSGSGAKKVIKKAQLEKTMKKAAGSKDIRDKTAAVSHLLNNQ